MSGMSEKIDSMISAGSFAVVGASTDPSKYGHIAYKTLKAAGKRVYPVNAGAEEIDGDPCYPRVSAVPEVPDVVVVVIPPPRTERLIPQLAELGVKNVWMQPGAESAGAVAAAEAAGIATVHSGPCIMVNLRTRLGR